MFVVDGKTITLEYSRDKSLGNSQKYKHEERIEREPRILKSDWICGHCNGQNFAKRNECYRCSQPKSENSLLVNPSGEPLVDTIMTTDTPGTFLVAQGFNPLISEDEIANIFRQFAVVKSCVLVMDYSKQISRGIAYIEFHTVEYAAFCIDGVKKVGLKVEDGRDIKLNYANTIYMNKLLTVQQQQYQQFMNPMAMAALQAAQWSSSNTFLQQQQQQIEAYNTALYNATMKPKSVWPPVFETNGGAYVFQAQSGSFFEQISGFYYFPKTKLYYNSSTAEYFVHSPGNDPPFAKYDASAAGTTQINNVDPSTSNIEDNTSGAVKNNVNVAELMKKPVIISLGAANKKNSTGNNKKVLVNQWAGDNDDDVNDDSKMNSNKPLPPVVKSKYAKAGPIISTSDAATTIDLSKYGPPAQSDKNNSNVGSGNRSRSDSNVDNPIEVVSGTQTGNTATVNATANTNGKFICHLCKRQFNSAQHLAQHEQGSQLHKDNLMKRQAEENGPVYRDRAAERRNTFGSSDPAVTLRYYNDNNDEASSGDKKRRKEDHTPAIVSAPVSLVDDNSSMGNQLLRKMGWNDGKGLGKEENGMSETVAEKMSQNNRSGTNKTVGIGTSVGPSIDYGSEEQYAQSLRIAAKFRYDQINDKK